MSKQRARLIEQYAEIVARRMETELARHYKLMASKRIVASPPDFMALAEAADAGKHYTQPMNSRMQKKIVRYGCMRSDVTFTRKHVVIFMLFLHWMTE